LIALFSKHAFTKISVNPQKAVILNKATSTKLEKALALQTAGELDAALSLFAKVLSAEPKNAVAL
jgi:hypothetical protein